MSRLGTRLGLVALAVGMFASGQLTLPAGAAQPKAPKAEIHAAQSWYRHVLVDLSPLDTSLVAGLQSASQWQDGTVTAAVAHTAFGTDIGDLQVVRNSLERLAPLPGQVAARTDYLAAVDLYRQAFGVEDAATQLPAGPLVTQLQRSFERIRQLGDVTYDQGTAQLAPLLGKALAGSDVQAARNVPDWETSGLAPGLPLESLWRGNRHQPAGSQSATRWDEAVRADGAPSPATIQTELGRSSAEGLARVARSLQQAEDDLDTVPGLAGAPAASALLRLGLLVDAESALAAEASRLTTAPPDAALAKVATALASIGNGLRSSAAAK